MKFSVEDLDISIAPFTRKHSRLMILMAPVSRDEGAENGLFLSYSANVPNFRTRYELIRIIPTIGGEPVPFEYTANPGVLKLTAGGGEAEICFDGREIVRFRAKGGLGLRFNLRFVQHEQFMDRLDGTVYAAFQMLGEYLFEPTHGTQSHNGRWISPVMTPAETDVEWKPAEDGRLEGYIRNADYSATRPGALRDFDECVGENLADFQNWCKHYAEVPEKYEGIRLYSIYIIWTCLTWPKGHINDNMVWMSRAGAIIRAVGWQQSYQAMACRNNLDFAIGLVHSMFTLQDEFGQIPDGVSDQAKIMTAPKPPFQGFAFSYILDKAGAGALTTKQNEMLYKPLCKWVEWWLANRDRDGDGLVAYIHGDESGWDDASIFSKGAPVATPDIAAFLVLCMEACGKLAAGLGLKAESEAWQARSEEMLKKMIDKFWNGQKFVCLLDKTHEIVDVESIAVYQPIILGKRLPQEIIDKIADALAEPGSFLTQFGFVSESMKSKDYDVTSGAFMRGTILAPVQCMIIVGLYNAGKTELALKAAAAWCDEALVSGPQAVSRRAPVIGTPAPLAENPVMPAKTSPASLSSWGPAVFLILAPMLKDIGERS